MFYIEERDNCFVNLGLYNSAPTWNSVDCQTATPNNTSDKVYCNCRASNYGCSGGYSSYYTNDYF